jgi:hypothetical protein
MAGVRFKNALLSHEYNVNMNDKKDKNDIEWQSMDRVHETYTKHFNDLCTNNVLEKDRQVLASGIERHKNALADVLYNFHIDYKNYWSQFGFLSNSSLKQFVSSIAHHVTIHHNQEHLYCPPNVNNTNKSHEIVNEVLQVPQEESHDE